MNLLPGTRIGPYEIVAPLGAGRSRHEYLAPFWLAVAADAAGLREDAMRYVERCVIERDSFIVVAHVISLFSGIRKDPRFEGIVRGVWA